ncbi:unnamed protein product [Caenorhabditis auriculariae]|uniref:Uncharacterized protein n=1 Tax=Caenorhabditis auriculariae TaxID=2777116 RepID=A0A8S1I0L9_9PELO|nr:unnamed protein product [Caenorhabditis auriculariae]
MPLQNLVAKKIFEDVIRPLKTDENGKQQWNVLVLDKFSSKMVSCCLKMSNLTEENISTVEDLHKKRQPIRNLDVIYLVSPTAESYKKAHIFFTTPCSDTLFRKLAQSRVSSFIKTLKEINLAFLPVESQVFSLNLPEVFPSFFGSQRSPKYRAPKFDEKLGKMAEQIATLCVLLEEYPAIRCRRLCDNNIELCIQIEEKLQNYKKDYPNMGKGYEKSRSQLIIVDRGFDFITPLLHEMTYQAMAQDLLTLNEDSILDENDPIWLAMRHNHIAVVSAHVGSKMKELQGREVAKMKSAKVKEISNIMKSLPAHQRIVQNFSAFIKATKTRVQL